MTGKALYQRYIELTHDVANCAVDAWSELTEDDQEIWNRLAGEPTPGPWEVNESDDDGYNIDATDTTGGTVAVAWSEDNAHLIARAPAMHALLTELLDYKREQFDGQGDLNISNADVVDWLTTFRERVRASLI